MLAGELRSQPGWAVAGQQAPGKARAHQAAASASAFPKEAGNRAFLNISHQFDCLAFSRVNHGERNGRVEKTLQKQSRGLPVTG